jgi:hypothetical protein
MINRNRVNFDTAGQRVIINPGELTNTGGDNWDITPSGYVPLTSVTPNDVPNTIPERDANCGFSVGNLQIDLTPPVAQTADVGKMVWNDTDGTIEFELKGGNVSIPIGEKEVIRCRNIDAAPMVKGQVVYITGSSGSHKEIKLANASAEATSASTIGVVAETIAVNQEGFVVTTGLVKDINTLALTQGAPVWLSTVSGQMTTTRPTAPNHGVHVGFCVRQHATVGVVYVAIDNGWELDELHNVYITAPATGDVLVYDAVSKYWKNLPTASQPWVLKAGDTMTGLLNLVAGQNFPLITKPSTPTATLAGTGGAVTAGGHIYYVTFYTSTGETQLSSYAVSAAVTVPAGGDNVNLTNIAVSTDPSVIGRKIYRSPANVGLGTAFIIATIANNVSTTYTDTTPDPGSYSNAFNRDNTTNPFITVDGASSMLVGTSSTTLGNSAAPGIVSGTATGGSNVAVGARSMNTLTTGYGNVCVGQESAVGITTGYNNVIIGTQSGYWLQGALSNVCVGTNAGRSIRGNSNVSLGHFNMAQQGFFNLPNASIQHNCSVGVQGLYGITSGSHNCSLGSLSGSNITSAASCIVIGAGCNFPSATTSAQLNIGNVIYGLNMYGNANNPSSTPQSSGRIGIGLTTPTARLHLPAGTTAASSAPLKLTSGSLMTAAEAGAVEFLTDKAYLTITTGTARKELTLNDTALTAGQQPTTTTNGRLINSNKFSIYATGTTNGAAGSAVNLTLFTLPNNGDLRFLRITVKAKSAAAMPDIFGRTLDAMWGNGAGVLTQVGADQLGTALTVGNLAAATIATTAAGTTLRVTCTDVTGCAAVVTWEVFGEYY